VWSTVFALTLIVKITRNHFAYKLAAAISSNGCEISAVNIQSQKKKDVQSLTHPFKPVQLLIGVPSISSKLASRKIFWLPPHCSKFTHLHLTRPPYSQRSLRPPSGVAISDSVLTYLLSFLLKILTPTMPAPSIRRVEGSGTLLPTTSKAGVSSVGKLFQDVEPKPRESRPRWP
jgi:hypothetical protein